ncbi:palmitoyltransferase ZDHHC22 [Spea bombifrons]|uniref:palmitoyltransferase ZDHHC22 n=1 Tax=Spea bombifrons TaxID=233779 RepID=UPI002349F9DB|nr:palmitoyltransferase ZDHHC22 [Spea bombifrons]
MLALLQLLNLLAPLYFLCLLAVTLSLQLFLFLPDMCVQPSASLPLSGLLHSSVFMILLVNTLGNYILVIWNSPGAGALSVEPDKPVCQLCARVLWDREHHCFFTGTCIGRSNLRSFVLFCLHSSLSCFHAFVMGVGFISENFSLSFCDPGTFLRLLPLSITRFFSGSLLSSDMLVVLMLYLWFSVGLACAAFCCHQLRNICTGLISPQRQRAEQHIATWRENLKMVFGKRWLLAILIPQPMDK